MGATNSSRSPQEQITRRCLPAAARSTASSPRQDRGSIWPNRSSGSLGVGNCDEFGIAVQSGWVGNGDKEGMPEVGQGGWAMRGFFGAVFAALLLTGELRAEMPSVFATTAPAADARSAGAVAVPAP